MEALLALLVGGLYAAGIYMLLRRSYTKIIIGLSLLAHGSHLLIFTVSKVFRAKAPVIPEGLDTISGPVADPLPQAVILTAIVISFGLTAFSIILIKMIYVKTQISDIEEFDE